MKKNIIRQIELALIHGHDSFKFLSDSDEQIEVYKLALKEAFEDEGIKNKVISYDSYKYEKGEMMLGCKVLIVKMNLKETSL